MKTKYKNFRSLIKKCQDELLAKGQPLRVCDKALFQLSDLVLFALHCNRNPFAFVWFKNNHRN